MNKKFKIVSSIALAGMLLTGGLGMNKVNAAESEELPPIIDTTNVLGVYRKLVAGKTVVPIVLANTDDRATVKELVDSDIFTGEVSKINGNAVTSLDTALCTGDRVTTTDGTEFTVVVYGDVDRDGAVTVLDALDVQEYSVGNAEFDDVQKEAADVLNDDGIDIMDALYIREYVVGNQGLVAPEPAPEEEVTVESNYTLSLKDASYINTENVDAVPLSVELGETLDEKKDLTLEVLDKDGNKITVDNKEQTTVTIPAHTDYVEDITKGKLDLSAETVPNGTITFNLYDGETLVATLKVEKNTVVPAVANVTTKRTATTQATLSLESMGESNVTKVRYVVKAVGEAPATEVKELTNSLDVSGNKLTDAVLDKVLETNTAYVVYYVVENGYGSQSEIASAVIAKDGTDVKVEKAVDEVTKPDLTKGETAFTWKQKEAGKTYVATLYRDGVAVSEEVLSETTTSNKFADDMQKPGTYKVSVVVKGEGDGTTTNSPATESEEVTVTKLDAVKDLKFENTDEGVVLSWTNSYSKDDFDSYNIKIEKFDNATGKFVDSKIPVSVNKTDDEGNVINKVSVTLANNTIYVAKVTLIANGGQTAVLSSDEATSEEFYIVKEPDMDNVTKGTTSVTFTLNPITIANKQVSYKLEVCEVNYTDTDYDPTDEYPYTVIDTKDVSIGKDGTEVTVDGLQPENDYSFRLIAIVDGNEVKSGYTDPIVTLPVIENLTVTDKEGEATENSGKIYSDGSTLKINGKPYSEDELADVAKIVNGVLKPGDVITVNDKNISIKLEGNASVESDASERDFSNVDRLDLTDTTVEIEGNNYAKTIKGTFDNLVLKGNGSRFDLSGVKKIDNESKVTLTDGVVVTSIPEVQKEVRGYTIEAGATVTINGLEITTAEELTLTADKGKNVVVAANTTENDLVFVNTTAGSASIEFAGDDNNASEQRGKITIVTNGGSVKVTSDKVNVSADITVEVTAGTATITDPSLTGNKTVTITADEGDTSKLVANTVTEAPEELIGETVKLAEYEDTDDYVRKTYGTEGQLDQDKVIAIREYINSFGLKGTKAEIKVDKADAVTITLKDEAQDIEIGNIK